MTVLGIPPRTYALTPDEAREALYNDPELRLGDINASTIRHRSERVPEGSVQGVVPPSITVPESAVRWTQLHNTDIPTALPGATPPTAPAAPENTGTLSQAAQSYLQNRELEESRRRELEEARERARVHLREVAGRDISEKPTSRVRVKRSSERNRVSAKAASRSGTQHNRLRFASTLED